MKKPVLLNCFFILACLIFAPADRVSANELWVKKTPMPTPRSGAACAVVNDKIYVIGGYLKKEDKYVIVGVNERYDPKTDRWRKMAPMPSGRSGAATAVVDDKIYVFAGMDAKGRLVSSVERYDPEKNAWKTVTSMPTPRIVPGAVVIDEKIYVLGGANWSDDKAGVPHYLSVNEVYDPRANKWSVKKAMTSARPRPCVVVHDMKIYCIGGGQNNGYLIRANERYDPKTDSWEALYPMPTARTAAAAGIIGDKIYVIGGYTFEERSAKCAECVTFLSVNEEYDIRTNTWREALAMPMTRGGGVGAVVDNKIYCIGGYNHEAGFLGLNEEYSTAFQ